MTAPAPLAAAIEEARIMSEAWDRGDTDAKAMFRATRKLLLALGADDRLAKAEASLREIARAECRLTTLGYKVTCVQAVAQYPGECLECASCIARRYFAEKGDDRG